MSANDCPICGGEPVVERESLQRVNGWAVKCPNPTCPLSNIEQDNEYGGFNVSWPTPEEAEAAWNARPERCAALALLDEEREWLQYAIDHMNDDSEPEDKTCAVVLERLLSKVGAK